MNQFRLGRGVLVGFIGVLLANCGGGGEGGEGGVSGDSPSRAATPVPPRVASLNSDAMHNPAAYIPPQCYTKTAEDSGARQGQAHNACYACHNQGVAPNFVDDSDLQTSYTLPEFARTNQWNNLFVDRTAAIAALSDAKILAYVRQDNYHTAAGGIALHTALRQPPAAWDADGNGRWDGYVPDAYFHFDDHGFDRSPQGGFTGWRAFAYAPFLGTFWPTNGSTDDVLIRLAPAFRETPEGGFDLATYRVNLAIVEALIRRQDVPMPPVDEQKFGVDLNQNGRVDIADRVVFRWAPAQGQTMQYVGRAGKQQAAGTAHLAAGLYPEGTEFIHTVRYLDPVGGAAKIGLSARMKEVRYAIKTGWNNYAQLNNAAYGEVLEDMRFPDRLRRFRGDNERGLQNGLGWVYSGFIEDAKGDLRPQSKEELYACMGCHSALGVTTDASFAFPRKLEGDQADGWYHWTQRAQGLNGLPEPRYANGVYEYTQYLALNHAGDEFRENRDIMAKFIEPDGRVNPAAAQALHGDMGRLLLPSAERALALNKAYYLIVQEQSFNQGRDALLEPPVHIHHTVDEDQPTGVPAVYLIPRS